MWAVIYAVWPSLIPLPLFRPLICVLSANFIFVLTKLKLDTIISAYLFSFGASFVLNYLARFAIFTIAALFISDEYVSGTLIESNQPVNLLLFSLVFILQLLLAVLFFRIRRFKKGFPFLFKKYAIIVALVATGTILVLITWLNISATSEDVYAGYLYVAGVLIIGVGLFIWIRRGIQKYKRKWGRKQNEELHQQEVAELTRELQQYKDMYETIRAANHSVRHRQAALERRVISIFEQAKLKLSAEASEELTMAITDIRELSEEYCQKVEQVKVDMILPSTNILAIDGLFRLFSERFADNNIDFKLKVKGSIIYMVNNFIPQSKLETMIGDHLQNAMIAVSAAKNSVDRNVLAVIGEADGPYEFSVHDGGIPFEADTLERLGTKHTTTHANDGGSGIGFMTTFETMQESGASLIIKENPPGGAFSTSVTIRFDGRNQYIIETYRPGDFSESDRYFVIGCK